MENKDILNEAFFKKTTYAEKRQAKLPQYVPVENKRRTGLGSLNVTTADTLPAYEVTDTAAVKKRLANGIGAAFGNNNIKSLASKALKTFPIIVSEHVEPETVVMLKKLMEEQYAEYINLLVSNQVVDLSAYTAADGTTIALQALDDLSDQNGSGRAAMADKISAADKFDPDIMFSNQPLYSLLRENAINIKNDGSELSELLENAIIVPTERADDLVKFIKENADDIALMEWDQRLYQGAAQTANFKGATYRYPIQAGINRLSYNNLDKAGEDKISAEIEKNYRLKADAIENKRIYNDINRGFEGIDQKTGHEKLSKITSADIVLDKARLDSAINSSVGEILCDPNNAIIRDRFEKATFLLQTRRIGGAEYYRYLVMRLGIPVSDAARDKLVKEYPMRQVITVKHDGRHTDLGAISKKEAERISSGLKQGDKLLSGIFNSKVKDALTGVGSAAIGAGAGLGTAVGTGLITTGGVSLMAMPAIGWTILAGAGAGLGTFAAIKALRRHFAKKAASEGEGWERVEALIDAMDAQQADLLDKYTAKKNSTNIGREDDSKFTKAAEIRLGDYYKQYSTALRSSLALPTTSKQSPDSNKLSNLYGLTEDSTFSTDVSKYRMTLSKDMKAALQENLNLLDGVIQELCEEDEEFRNDILNERKLATTATPVKTQYISTKPDTDVLLVPSEYAKTTYNYGSAEIDRKTNKDRRYNQPLVMTIRFKGRYDDGRTEDGALTAVIGILGKIIRIPSNEMEYVLKENALGGTNPIKSIVSDTLNGKMDNLISDLLSTVKVDKSGKLPQSGETWRNLEKVSTLAAANALAGRKNKNLANAHIIFSQREIDNVKSETNIDYLHDIKKTAAFMKKYSAFTLMIANDPSQRVYIFDDLDAASWSQVPYSAIAGKDSGDQLNAVFNKLIR